MPFDIQKYVQELVRRNPAITAAWLIGSRANGTAKPTSDWDILVFADAATLQAIKDDKDLHKVFVDLLIVKENGEFEKPWGCEKRGSLSSWHWHQTSPTGASYQSVKFNPDGLSGSLGEMITEQFKAIRLCLQLHT